MTPGKLPWGLLVAFAAGQWAFAAPELTNREFQERLGGAVVKVLASEGTGTGFLLNDQGHVATNQHVVEGSSQFAVQLGTRRKNAVLVWADAALDLAVLKADDAAGLKTTVLALSPPPKGAKVTAIGFPGAAEIVASRDDADSTRTAGIVGKFIPQARWSDGGRPVQVVQHSAQISEGNSGGPLVDACGRVVGINTRGPSAPIRSNLTANVATGIFWASFIGELAAKLDDQGIPYESTREPCEERAAAAGGASSQAVEGLERQIEEVERRIAESDGADADAEAELDDLRSQLAAARDAQAEQAEQAEQTAQKVEAMEDSVTGLREEFANRWLTTVLVFLAAVLVLTGIAFVAFASFRKATLEAAGRLREQASRIVAPSRRAAPARRPSAGRGAKAAPGTDAGGQPTSRIRIGRSRKRADVVFDSDRLSRLHAELEATSQGRYILTDRDSTNGTAVFRDGRWHPIRQDIVTPNERLRLADRETTAAEIVRLAGLQKDCGTAEPRQEDRGAVDDRPEGAVRRDPVTGEVIGIDGA